MKKGDIAADLSREMCVKLRWFRTKNKQSRRREEEEQDDEEECDRGNTHQLAVLSNGNDGGRTFYVTH